ncbi:right-handed parallel beta-helix repeat-containing protein [Paenibacillus mesophilus]|uniref:right-handed parallel beta-helix repeat-containing protein n=1 Tax=Paenibacillus mesophilus TaxID=2582849 RepID=UPI00110D421A|nr:right-handed parallel beta-helix repeat-containing protein [Paenibacillus mesophilus]TMV52770.1 right-handed parallel beta-helix repeat-containing protein [Paenibacillus mesophilus]
MSNLSENELIEEITEAVSHNRKCILKYRKVYEIGTTIEIPSGADIDFNKSVIRRKAGSGAFDLLRNANPVGGDANIRLANVTLDGNREADAISPETPGHRFSGLRLERVSRSRLANVTVIGTVNAEIDLEGASGVYFKYCSDVDAYGLNGYDNDRTAVLIDRSSRVRILGSETYGNKGSGVSSYWAEECEYHHIVTHHNGYSNLSINGKRSKASNVLTYASGYSGLNVGHENEENRTDDTVIMNVHSYDNTYEGLTVAGSARVQVTNLIVHGNKRNNINLFRNSTETRLTQVVSRQSAGGQGILVQSGHHFVVSSTITGNAAHGIYVKNGAAVTVGSGVTISNNAQSVADCSGIVLENSERSMIMGAAIFDDQSAKTQGCGITIDGGGHHTIALNRIEGNKYDGLRVVNEPAGMAETLALITEHASS